MGGENNGHYGEDTSVVKLDGVDSLDEENGKDSVERSGSASVEPTVTELSLAPDSIKGEELVSIELKASAAVIEGGALDEGPVDELYIERQKARKLFFHIQLFSASLGAFAHGANDTASCVLKRCPVFQLKSNFKCFVLQMQLDRLLQFSFFGKERRIGLRWKYQFGWLDSEGCP